jgi:hypothetical protein
MTASGPPENGKGVQFRMTVSLGNIIQLGMLCVMGIVGWTTIQDRQAAVDRIVQEQQKEIQSLAERQELSAELNAREAAIVDGMEKRINRIEGEMDRRK